MSNTLQSALSDALKDRQPESGRVVHPSPAGRTFEPLTLRYIAGAVESFERLPSPALKNETFRLDLMHWRSLTTRAIKERQSRGEALLLVVQAIASTEGNLAALRYIRAASNQLLWQASVDIGRDRRGTEPESDSNVLMFGDPSRDPDYVAPPTEDEAMDAYLEAHGWLSTIADLLPVDEDERTFLNLDSGLEYMTVREDGSTGHSYRGIFDPSEAIERQLAKNEEAFAKRAARNVEAKRDAFVKLAQLVVG